ncbi:hypothetical protein [Anaerovorax sp. IOR16]|uniref:hypothetical protein n=1 Tax=Anaerovorax sp. IOR16 TaxID=2773458 RepID=UPI0019D28A04|nr:hypothetical protein [Anaerovorax sp. IOR16]
MIDYPDLLGMVLEEALELLKKKDIPYQVSETAPRKKEALEGIQRVINQKNKDGICHLIVCKVPDVFRK